MKRLAIAAALVLLSGPVFAQGFGMGSNQGGQKTRYSEEEKKAEAANEKAYRDAVKNTQATTGEAYDPWRNIRNAGAREDREEALSAALAQPSLYPEHFLRVAEADLLAVRPA